MGKGFHEIIVANWEGGCNDPRIDATPHPQAWIEFEAMLISLAHSKNDNWICPFGHLCWRALKAQRPFRKYAAMVRPSLVVKFLKAFDHWLESGIGWVPYMTVAAAKYYPTARRPDAMSGNPSR